MHDPVAQKAMVIGLIVAAGVLSGITLMSAPLGPASAGGRAPEPAESAQAPTPGTAANDDESAGSGDVVAARSGEAPSAGAGDSDDLAAPAEPTVAPERSEPGEAPTDSARLLRDEDDTPSNSATEELVPSEPAGELPWRRIHSREAPCQFHLRSVVVARGIRGREPQRSEGPYEANGEPLYLYFEAQNDAGQRARARARFHHAESGTTLTGTADIGVSSRWRTWVDFVIPPARLGTWTVHVLDDERCLAGETTFEMIPPGWQ